MAYNAAFDKKSLQATIQFWGNDLPESNWQCIMQAYKRYRGYDKPVKLAKACQEMNVRAGTHRAKEDALAAARVLYRMAQGK